MTRIQRLRLAAALLLPLLGAGCEYAVGALEPVGGRLASGRYLYSAWSDFGGREPAWWGYLQLRVHLDGEISGSYRLPDQCTDAYRYRVDCVGLLGGRIYRDGTLRLGFDEGWLRNEGEVYDRYEAFGDWESRLVGYSDAGTWELVRR